MSTLAALGCIAALAGCGSGGGSRGAGPSQTTSSTNVKLALNTATAPWPTPAHVPDWVAAAGLPHSPTESLTVHYHAHLDILVNGRSEPVAPSIGRVDQNYFSPLHTHATSGLIHIEAASDARFTLGMLFTEWGVRLTGACVGGYCRPGISISVYVDGKIDREAMPSIMLRKGEEIAVVIGAPPESIPSGWDCRARIDPTIENPAQCADFGQ